MAGPSRRTLIRGMTALGALAKVGNPLTGAWAREADAVKDAPCGESSAADAPSLATLAARQGRWFGCSVKDPLFSDGPFQRLVIEQCNMLVCTYSMKWRQLEPEPGQFTFKRSDPYVDFAEQHGMQFRGHALVWERQLPPWLPDALKSDGFSAFERHIRGVAKHYAGRMHSWDVVNETVLPEQGRSDRLKNNIFLETLGPSYIEAAFRIAHEADPGALLYCNSNPAPYGRAHDRAHFEGVIALLDRLKSQGAPVHGLGLQGHLAAAYDDRFDDRTLSWFFEEASAMSLQIMITELDVTDKWMPAGLPLRDQKVAATYRRFLDIALAFPAVKAVLTWGLTDRYTGLNRWPRPDGWAVRGLPYDHCLQPKLAREAIAQAFLAHEVKSAG
jgi:endo-1,4-beta-xylanase